jgi:multiple sugar transport system substrate-binding protein
MFLKDRTIPRAALTWDDSGNNIAYQTGRAAFIINPPSVWYWMVDNDKTLLGNSMMVSVPKGPGAGGKIGNAVGSWVWQVSKASKHADLAKDWLRWFYQPDHYRAVIEKVGGRWAPIYPRMFETLPLFAGNPAFSDFRTLANDGFVDGYAGPPNVLAGKVYDANILTKVLQKVLVDRVSVDEAVMWGQQQIQDLAKGG